MNYDNRITGRIIKNFRKKKGLTQDVLSGLSGIGRSHLAMIESGEKNANVDTLWRISNALGLPLSKLFSIVEDEVSKENQKFQRPSKEIITELCDQSCISSDQKDNIPVQEPLPDNKLCCEEIS